jgi:ribosomal protein S18 acetylase RimI-like enzyme
VTGSETLGEFTLDVSVVIRELSTHDIDDLPRSGFFRYDTSFWDRNRGRYAAGEVRMLVASVNDMPVARLSIDMTHAGAPRLWAFDVLQPLRGMGIGARMMEVAEDLARAAGFPCADIAVEKENIDARRLYERLGYRKIGSELHEETHRQPDGQMLRIVEDCFVLRKTL